MPCSRLRESPAQIRGFNVKGGKRMNLQMRSKLQAFVLGELSVQVSDHITDGAADLHLAGTELFMSMAKEGTRKGDAAKQESICKTRHESRKMKLARKTISMTRVQRYGRNSRGTSAKAMPEILGSP